MICALLAVTDGDTIRTDCGRIRLANIDAPEARKCPQDAAEATAALARLLAPTVRVEALYRDRYGRIVGIVEARGKDAGAAMVAQGYAKPWPHDATGRAMTDRPEWRCE